MSDVELPTPCCIPQTANDDGREHPRAVGGLESTRVGGFHYQGTSFFVEASPVVATLRVIEDRAVGGIEVCSISDWARAARPAWHASVVGRADEWKNGLVRAARVAAWGAARECGQ